VPNAKKCDNRLILMDFLFKPSIRRRYASHPFGEPLPNLVPFYPRVTRYADIPPTTKLVTC
jgi:hypothetical protein